MVFRKIEILKSKSKISNFISQGKVIFYRNILTFIKIN